MTTDYLLHRQVEHVLAALTPSNRLVCRVMLHTGLRVSDVLGLKTERLARRMWITEGKTGKRRQIGLSGDLYDACKSHAGTTYVFPHRLDPNKHRSRQTVWWDIKRAAKAFRLPQTVGSHSMRKVYAVELLRRYGDIMRVQRALKHDRQSTTMIYAMADRLLRDRM